MLLQLPRLNELQARRCGAPIGARLPSCSEMREFRTLLLLTCLSLPHLKSLGSDVPPDGSLWPNTTWPPPLEGRRVAILFAGLFRAVPEEEATAASFKRAVVTPLKAAGLHVDIFVAGAAEDKEAWLKWFERAGVKESTVFTTMTPLGEGLPLNKSHVAWCVWGNGPGEVPGVHEQFKHNEEVWQLFKAAQKTRTHDFVIKARVDFLHHPRQALKPCWLAELPPHTILMIDKALQHTDERWNERGAEAWMPPKSYYPEYASDQWAMGHRVSMEHFMTLHSQPPLHSREECPAGQVLESPETVVAKTLAKHKVAVHHVSFQIVAIKLVWVLKERGDRGWLHTPCRACYDCVNHF